MERKKGKWHQTADSGQKTPQAPQYPATAYVAVIMSMHQPRHMPGSKHARVACISTTNMCRTIVHGTPTPRLAALQAAKQPPRQGMPPPPTPDEHLRNSKLTVTSTQPTPRDGGSGACLTWTVNPWVTLTPTHGKLGCSRQFDKPWAAILHGADPVVGVVEDDSGSTTCR